MAIQDPDLMRQWLNRKGVRDLVRGMFPTEFGRLPRQQLRHLLCLTGCFSEQEEKDLYAFLAAEGVIEYDGQAVRAKPV